MKMMVDILQMEELDVSGALLAMQETKESLYRIRNDEDGINSEVEAVCLFARKLFDVDAEAEFKRIHRICVPPRHFHFVMPQTWPLHVTEKRSFSH